MRSWGKAAAVALAAGAAAAAAQEQAARPVPYWASIAAGDALMRTGPGATYPAIWRYRRADLPVRVLQIHESWRRVADPAGVEGWMAAALLSKRRTGLVVGQVRELRAEPSDAASIAWRVEPGVVGRLSRCKAGWCLFDARGRRGYLRQDAIWGMTPGEAVE